MFSHQRQKWVHPDGKGEGEKLGGVERRGSLIRIHCIKQGIFNKIIDKINESLTEKNFNALLVDNK